MASFEFVGSVSNSFGTRTAQSEVAQGQDEARTIANGVLSTVNGHLDDLSTTGETALGSALDAIGKLADFHPTTISVTYTPPSFVGSTAVSASNYSAASLGGNVNAAPSISFAGRITPVNLPSVSGTAPLLGGVEIGPQPELQTVGGAPVAPTITDITVPQAPDVALPSSFTLPTLTVPTLKQLDLPTFRLLPLPDYQPVAGTALPEVPRVASHVEIEPYQVQITINENPELQPEATLVGPQLVEREVREAIEFLRARGLELSNELESSQIAYASENAGLQNAAEYRQYRIGQFLRDVEVQRAVLVFLGQKDELIVNAALSLARSAFEAEMLQAESQLDIARALVSLYNARVAAYNTESEIYRVQVEARLSELEKWKVEIEAEVAKTRANAQVAQNYAQLVQAVAAKADVYQAQVQALFANVEGHKAKMQAVATQADVARAQLSIYGGKTDAYVASLAGYRAQFEAYAAQTRGVAAQNAIEQARTQISVAEISAVGAQAANTVAQLQLDSENLKLQAVKLGATYEETKLKNTIETLKAQIAGDVGRARIQEWAAQIQRTDAENEAVIDNAQAAVRYYTSASDSAQRAADQALRAVTSATQAAAVAQETAGKAAASLAQGAYSAIHVSASLQGGGRISANEERSDRIAYSFSDMLTYTESRDRTLSA